jgi:multidrug efflux pump subunit AcrA (membrane-fusion protein)
MSKLHDNIMHLQANPEFATEAENLAYKLGHKTARHAAAEMAAEQAVAHDNEVQELQRQIAQLNAQLNPRLENERRAERVRDIAKLLAPTYHYNTPIEQRPLAHPECHNWSSGGHIVEHYPNHKEGGEHLEMEFIYNGGVDKMDFLIPEHWLHADNYPVLIEDFLNDLYRKLAEEKRVKQVKDAEAALEKAQRNLEELNKQP